MHIHDKCVTSKVKVGDFQKKIFFLNTFKSLNNFLITETLLKKIGILSLFVLYIILSSGKMDRANANSYDIDL
jgi:hypothetical protein